MVGGLQLALSIAPAAALDAKREVVTLHTVELPIVSVEGLDLGKVRGEAAFGAVKIGDPILMTTKSICVPKGSKSFKDAVEIPTHYYQVPYRVRGGAMVLRDGDGRILHTEILDELESYERYGYDECRYWLESTLTRSFQEHRASFETKMIAAAREYFETVSGRAIDAALFAEEVAEKYPVYTFKDKKRDYSDLDEASGLALAGYAAIDGRVAGAASPEFDQAIAIWEAALAESDVNDKAARINRKVTVKLHENLGAAWIALDDPGAAILHLEKATRFGMSTSRSSGIGSADLLERARQRKVRAIRNPGRDETPPDTEVLLRAARTYRGHVPVKMLPTGELARLEAEHGSFAVDTVVELAEVQTEEREEAIAAGEVNPYEHLVSRTASQGFLLFLMPFTHKLTGFPVEVCELTHLNQLRMPNQGIDEVPSQIGNLTELKVLDLSGNRIGSLPEEIGMLEKLKVLKLKGNPLAPGEIARLGTLLPDAKIKF